MARPLSPAGLCIYFHLNLQHLWEAIGTLPAVFPDGYRLNQEVYPWLFNWLPSVYFIQTRQGEAARPAYWFLEKCIAVLIAWFFVPFTMLVLWFRYIYVRNYWLAHRHVALLTAAVWLGGYLCQLQGRHNGGEGRKLRKFILQLPGATGLFLVVIYGFSDGIINGTPAKT